MDSTKSASRAFVMIIDLDERGSFKGHVDSPQGEEVFWFSNEDDSGWPRDGFWLVEDGYMRHGKDTAGLLDYLISVGVASKGDTLTLD